MSPTRPITRDDEDVGHTASRVPMSYRRAGSAILAVLLCTIPFACGDQKDASLCTAFDEFLNARTTVRAIDPTDQNAAQASDIAENYLASVRRLEAAADGRYTQQLDALETAVNDVVRTLSSVQDDAEYATWAPLVEDDLGLAEDAAVTVVNAIGQSCPAETSVPTTSESSGTSGT
jgi:hypothetical protein